VAKLTFHLKMPITAPNMSDYLHIEIDSNLIHQIVTADSNTYKYEYVRVSIDISAWADGQQHNIRFKCNQSTVNGISNFVIDDVDISVNAGFSSILADSLFSIFPVPAQDILTLDYRSREAGTISLISLDGKTLFQSQISPAAKNEFDISTLPKGLYFVSVESLEGIFRKKILITP
jgi:hypothetical protein